MEAMVTHVVRCLIAKASPIGSLHFQPRQIFSPKTTQTVVERWKPWLRKYPGYRIAKPALPKRHIHGGGYYRGAKITSFIGIVPVESPAMVVDEPKGKASLAPPSRQVLSRSWKRYLQSSGFQSTNS